MQQQFDRAAEDLGNSIHLEHVNVTGARPAAGDPVLCHRPRADPRPLSDGVRHQHVGQCRPQPVSSAERRRRRCCAAIPASSSRAARPCSSGWPPSPKSSPAPHSPSASTTTMSRRYARGAIACAATSRTPRVSGASRSAFPMSSSTCRSGPRRPLPLSIREIMGIPAELKNGDGTMARAKMGKDQYLQFRETDRALPEYDGHHVQMYITNFSGPTASCGAWPGLPGRQPVPVPFSRHRRSRQMADTCSRSSTRCAAPRTRCICARWSTAIRPRPTAPTRTVTTNGSWAMGPDQYDGR